MKFLILVILILSIFYNNGIVNAINYNINNNQMKYDLSSSSSSSPSSLKCRICEFLVDRLEVYIEGNATQNQIEYFLDQDCKKFGGEYASPCTVYVNEYVPLLVNYMASHEKPDEACEQIKLC